MNRCRFHSKIKNFNCKSFTLNAGTVCLVFTYVMQTKYNCLFFFYRLFRINIKLILLQYSAFQNCTRLLFVLNFIVISIDCFLLILNQNFSQIYTMLQLAFELHLRGASDATCGDDAIDWSHWSDLQSDIRSYSIYYLVSKN